MFIIGEEMVSNPVEVILKLKSQVYDHERFENIEVYMEYMIQSIWRFHGKGLSIYGETLEEKCAALVSQLIDHELIIVQ